MALQQRSTNNIQLNRALRNTNSLKQSSNIGIGNENILPGKQTTSNVSKIPCRNVLGIVNSNCIPDRKVSNVFDATKPSTTTLNKPLSSKVNSTSNISQGGVLTRRSNEVNIKRTLSSGSNFRSSFLKPAVPKTIQTTKPAAPKPTIAKVIKPKVHQRIQRVDSTASLVCVDAKKCSTTLKVSGGEIEQCAQDLNNVSIEEDVDAGDKEDPLLLGCYVKDIYNYLFDLERKYTIKKDYLNQNRTSPISRRSVVPKFRTVLVDYMIQMTQEYKFVPETLYLAVYIVDKYLELEPAVVKNNLQCVGVTALFIAAKYDEVLMPPLDEFALMTDNSVEVKDILAMEILIITKLNFNFGRPYPITFLRRFSKVAQTDKIAHSYSKYFVDLALNEYTLVHILPSKIAAAAAYLAHLVKGIDMNKFWSKTMIHYTRYTVGEILPVVQQLALAVTENNSSPPKYAAVKIKYGTTSNACVSKTLDNHLTTCSIVGLKLMELARSARESDNMC